MKKLLFILCSIFLVLSIQAQVKKTTTPKKNVPVKKTTVAKKPVVKKIPGTRVKIITDSGTIVVRLYDSTPVHRDNFIKLVKEGFYDSLLFHRIITDFMIQGGDPTSKYAAEGDMLGNGGSNMERIPAEIKPTLINKRGALAAARDDNPEKASSACQFYIVTGKKFTAEELNMGEQQMGKKFTPQQRETYTTVGGAPWLDGEYTVFGEVESGMDVVDKISRCFRDFNDRPAADIRMKMEIIK